MRKLAYLFILLGIVIIVYPKASEWYANWQQDKIMAEWEQEMDQTAAADVQRSFADLTPLFDEGDETDVTPVSAPETEQPVKEEEEKPEAIATISIPSIKLNLPVMDGATQKNMKYGAAHMKETASFGKIGNTAVAAHRAKTKGRLFNRLNEVKEGDSIIITQQGKTFTYKVYATSVVKPSDVSVLNYNNKDKLLTLITCTPLGKSTHRLIVHAKLS
ncbi:class D sortase [Paenibacillus sp. NPDC058071]|uniref:class D sortase n=1 Tax=Paenibacillus sp. NPDC058071 TaxID=3346326 RepID=UPI0036D8617E